MAAGIRHICHYGNGNIAAKTTTETEDIPTQYEHRMYTYVSYFSYHRPLLNRLLALL
jgi:hypothetical protein